MVTQKMVIFAIFRQKVPKSDFWGQCSAHSSCTRAHLVRAAIEAMALQVREVQLAMEEATGQTMAELRVDGGAAQNQLLLEIQAALSGVPVVRPAFQEMTAFGAFRVAMLGCGAVRNSVDLPVDPDEPTVVAPEGSRVDRERLWRAWCSAVERSRGWANVWEG